MFKTIEDQLRKQVAPLRCAPNSASTNSRPCAGSAC